MQLVSPWPARSRAWAIGLASIGALAGGLPSEAAAVPLADAAPAATAPHTLGGADADTQIIVRFRGGVAPSTQAKLIAAGGMTLDRQLALPDTDVVSTTGSVTTALAWMRARPEVLWAERNRAVYANVEQSYSQRDPLWPKLWGLENFGDNGGTPDADIDIAEAWSLTRGGTVTVGVVDSGVDAQHPDLSGQLLAGMNFVADGAAGTPDGLGHGTHVTGTIVAAENTIGVIGAAPASNVIPLRVLGADGSGSTAAVTSAFAWAGQHGIGIVNASLGSGSESRAVRDAIVASPRTLFVVAAGNSGLDLDKGETTDYPCEFDLSNVLCVGATDRTDRRAAFSNEGSTSVDLLAPGQDIISTTPGANYAASSGTSMATPHASAVAALVASQHPDWSPVQIKNQLMATVDQPLALRGTSVTNGRLNAARAVGLYAGPDGLSPSRVVGVVANPGLSRVALRWEPVSSVDLALYQVEALVGGAWTEQQVTTDRSATVTGLTPGVPATFRIRGIDRSGEEGDSSDPVTVFPLSASAAANSSARQTQPGKTSAAASARCAILDLRRLRTRGLLRGISFRTTGACKVSISARRRAGSSTRGAPSRASLAIQPKAGRHAVRFGNATGDLRLASGIWTVKLAAGSSRAALRVSLR